MNLIAAAAAAYHHDDFTNLAITINVKSQLTITRFVNNAFNSNFNCNVGVAAYLCYKQRPSKKDKICHFITCHKIIEGSSKQSRI